jgi:Ca2+-binding RTX toxin-like protein
MKLIGETVRLENTIMSQLGETSTRLSCIGMTFQSYLDELDLGSSFIDNNPIDMAVVGFDNHGSQLMEIFTVDLWQTGDSTTDLVIGGHDSEYVLTGNGDDYIVDGAGNDILEGGAGNDRITLVSDSGGDIVIVGSGDDHISGGSSNDRLVLRVNGMTLVDGAEGLGDYAATTAIPLLGGFVFDGSVESGSITASYVGALQCTYNADIDPDVELVLPITRVQDVAASQWEEISLYTTEQIGANNVGTNQSSFSVNYELTGDALDHLLITASFTGRNGNLSSLASQ